MVTLINERLKAYVGPRGLRCRMRLNNCRYVAMPSWPTSCCDSWWSTSRELHINVAKYCCATSVELPLTIAVLFPLPQP